MTYRPKLFAGIDLDPQARRRCADVASRLERLGVRARFEAPEKLHITLAFLGWVEPEQVDAIAVALRAVSADAPPFTLRLDRIGAFPHERKPRIVWIGARDQGRAFGTLAHSLRGAYAQMGFPLDKEAVAHVTIARIKERSSPVPSIEFAPVRLRVTHLTLFESLPASRTTRYEVRERVPLQGAPSSRLE